MALARGDAVALETLWYAVVQAVRVIAPVMPFLAEHLWRNLVAEACDTLQFESEEFANNGNTGFGGVPAGTYTLRLTPPTYDVVDRPDHAEDGVHLGLAALEVREHLPGVREEGLPGVGQEHRPVPAVEKLAERLGIRALDFDVVELNEAFASQALACRLRLLQKFVRLGQVVGHLLQLMYTDVLLQKLMERLLGGLGTFVPDVGRFVAELERDGDVERQAKALAIWPRTTAVKAAPEAVASVVASTGAP